MSQHGIYSHQGTESLISLDATKFYTTPEALETLEAEDRNCYKDQEFDLKYTPYDLGFIYSLDNCQINAFVDIVIKNCSCLPSLIL